MNGAQDLGGMMGFGRVIPEPEDEVFHAEWERTAFALTLAAGSLGKWGIDAMRHERESLPPAQYLSSTYYEIWLAGLERMLVKTGLVTDEEIKLGAGRTPAVPLKATEPEQIVSMLARGTQYDRPATAPAAFEVGTEVITSHDHPTGHTRLPRYARGKRGVIERIAGHFVFPDTAAAGKGDQPQWLYTVTFAATELWGSVADKSLTVSIDAWESYLERA